MNRETIYQLFNQVREHNPLVHQITNNVTINDCANATLAIGGSPVMASSPEESGDMVKLAQALVINIGTLTNETFEGMKRAGVVANQLGIPIVFDPVGVGATSYRTDNALSFLKEVKVDIIRGNASELSILAGGKGVTKGVDAGEIHFTNDRIAETTARKFNCIAVASGQQDAISNGKETYLIDNGHPMLTKITGTGCMSTAIIGCFAGVSDNLFAAAIAGISVMGMAGEAAVSRLDATDGLGTFRVKLMDIISLMDGQQWKKGVKISEAISN